MSAKFIFDAKNVLIIGGAGFIGSHLADALVGNSKVICIDNFSSGSEKNIDHLLANPNFKFIKHDMANPIVLEDFTELKDFKVEFQGIQEVYNLACPTLPLHFDKNKINNLLANSYAVKNSLDLALKYQAKYMHLSSSVIYGQKEVHPRRVVEEDLGIVDLLSDRASYDEGKRFAETMVKTYHDVYKLDTKIIRPFRIYGPRMVLDQGFMIPDFISNALDNKDLVIYGDENWSSGFCYIDDCLSAMFKMMDSNLTGPINIGSDVEIKISELAQQVISQLESGSKITYADPLLFMTPLAVPNITKARDLLGWMPLVTLDNGLKKTIDDLRASKRLRPTDYEFIQQNP
jgi:UDP-glucuronate decarboxylase